MRIYFGNDGNEVTDVAYSSLSDFEYFGLRSAINCEGRSIFLGNHDCNNKAVYEFANGVYHPLPSLNVGRSLASVCYINKQLVVLGGSHQYGNSNSIETLGIDESSNDKEWKIILQSLPIPLCGHKAVEFKNKIIFTGGNDYGDSNRMSWEGQFFWKEKKIVWKEIGNMNYKRSGHFLFSFQNKVIVFGGNRSIGDNENDRVEYLDGERWKLGPIVPYNFNPHSDVQDAQSVLDRRGRIIIISNELGLVIFDIQKETFRHYPNFWLSQPRRVFAALLQ